LGTLSEEFEVRILYLSCHSILEYCEVKLFTELGHYVFSPGAYVEPANPGDASLRPGLFDLKYDPDDVVAYHALKCPVGVDRKDCLTREFVKRFDLVIVMHMPRWITGNWTAFLGTPVIWRTIGQSIVNTELELAPFRRQGLNIVRYSPMEKGIPGYIGEDAMIRFYVDPEEYKGWDGSIEQVLTVNQHIKQRHQACNYSLYEEVTREMPRAIMGPGNEEVHGSIGKGTFDELKEAMRNYRCYFYVGTHPASYTLNFVESACSGIPIVAIGSKFGNANYFPGHKLYEVDSLIQNGVNGFISDQPDELKVYCKELLNNHVMAKRIGDAGREMAIATFGKVKIAAEWNSYLETI
jgi:hypothetical protein